ncbi:MAG: nucleoside hydrolase [Planctomycetales bacterium]|nr:nucleoside hydrolase [Planctomycetales bacterium]
MARKVIIDCDPGIDDAVALCMALFDSRLDVVALTATSGNVSANQASRNIQAVTERLDPPRWPRFGVVQDSDSLSSATALHIHGDDGLGNIRLETSELHRQHPSDKVIVDTVHNAPGDVSIIALGPLTNIAAALKREPELAHFVDRLIIGGGSIHGIGNITPTAEFNMYCDAESARVVFQSSLAKTLVPLEVTEDLMFDISLLNDLPPEASRVGAFLRETVPFLFRSYRQNFGVEGIHLHDAVTLVAALHPEFFETKDMPGDVETRGELTKGMTVFDRRSRPENRSNMEVAVSLNKTAVLDAIMQCLRFAGQESTNA